MAAVRPFRPALLLAVWAVAIFVFFSLSGSKLPGYIVPIFPALGMLAAMALERIDERGWRRQLNAMLVIMAVGLLASPVVATLHSNHTATADYRRYAVWVAAAFVVMLTGLWLARRLLRTHGLMPSILVYTLALFTGFTTALLGHESIGGAASGASLVPAIRAVLKDDMPIYGVRTLDHTLPFYLRHTTVMVEHPDELEFGTQQEPQKWLPTLDSFIARWREGPPALAIMSADTYRELTTRQVPMHLVAQDQRRIVVANFPVPPSPGR